MYNPGQQFWFEYHCNESPSSPDAELWYHSHQLVMVISCSNPENDSMTLDERIEAGMPLVYVVQFADGFAGGAFEDELLDSPADYQRPNPPVQ